MMMIVYVIVVYIMMNCSVSGWLCMMNCGMNVDRKIIVFGLLFDMNSVLWNSLW